MNPPSPKMIVICGYAINSYYKILRYKSKTRYFKNGFCLFYITCVFEEIRDLF